MSRFWKCGASVLLAIMLVFCSPANPVGGSAVPVRAMTPAVTAVVDHPTLEQTISKIAAEFEYVRLVAERKAFANWVAAAHIAPRVDIGSAETLQVGATAPAVYGSMPCGGADYPPCYIAQRESGNTYNAYNPTGCGGNACYGRWQFSGAWAGKLGLPADLSTATPEQQDNAARELWNGGAGCGNWGACP